ncbi:cysteine desulfurase family protein [Blattabacterium cuenoti]|uniref:cysteine desulfurase family protein n=1 Tax=Blattabacterium cuenoti TaxID=1653831 RepID=UPI00163CAEF5|nr:cysteine desulfurase family protein [Blattabacterium cuenoti]
MRRAYLDNASSTPLRKEVLKTMTNVLKYTFGNPSSLQHSYGRSVRSIIEESRIIIANNINSSSYEILFTSGGTESNNLVIQLSINNLDVKHFITSKLEHSSVLQTIYSLSKKQNISTSFVNFDSNGTLDLNHLEEHLKKCSSKKILVSLMYANNEIGNLLLDLNNVIFLCKKYNAYFHSDTIQFIGNFPIDMKQLQIDFVTASAHKFYGPKGVGFIFIRENILKNIKFYLINNCREYGIRPGTENVSGIAGLSKALELSSNNFSDHIKKILELKSYCILKLKEIIPDIIFNGLSSNFEKSIPSILNFLYPIKKVDYLFYFQLDLMGISISKGSSCDSSNNEISHVIQSIVDKSLLKKMMPVRVSFGIFNKKKDIDLLIESLQKVTKII